MSLLGSNCTSETEVALFRFKVFRYGNSDSCDFSQNLANCVEQWASVLFLEVHVHFNEFFLVEFAFNSFLEIPPELHDDVMVDGLSLGERFFETNHKGHVDFIRHGQHEEFIHVFKIRLELVSGAVESY